MAAGRALCATKSRRELILPRPNLDFPVVLQGALDLAAEAIAKLCLLSPPQQRAVPAVAVRLPRALDLTMRFEPSNRSAAAAGAWSALGLVPFEAWMDRLGRISTLEHNLLWGGAVVVFFLGPAYFLVLGHGSEPFARTWFLDAGERARYAVVAKRMVTWFVSAAVVGICWSLILGLFRGRT